MTTQSPDSPVRTARLLHLALLATPVTLGLVAATLIQLGSLPPAGNPMVHFALVGVGLFLLIAGALLAFRIPTRPAGQSADDYWRGALPRAIMAWAAMEGGALLGAMAGLFAGTLLYPVLSLVAFAALMGGFSPGRISGG